MRPSGESTRDQRLEGIMGEDGTTNCGNAQNCVKACPMNIPLTRAIYEENRETFIYGLLGWLKKWSRNLVADVSFVRCIARRPDKAFFLNFCTEKV